MSKQLGVFGIASLLVLVSSASLTSSSARANEAGAPITYHQTLSQGQAVALEVSGDLGVDVDVIGTHGRAVDIAAVPNGSFASSVELKHWQGSDGMHVLFDLNGLEQSIRRRLHMHDTNVQVTMHIPTSANLRVEAENGPIAVKNVVAPLTVHLTNGPISVEGAGTVLSLRTVNGPIEVGITDLSREPDISLKVTNGEIDVSVPRGFKASVEAHTLIGSVDDGLSSHTGPGKLEANVTTGAITLVQR